MVRTDTVGYKIRLIHNQIHKRMEAKRLENEGELTGMQRWTLGYLREHDGTEVYQKDIEAAFSVSRATASNMLGVMERKGLICREAVAHDARLKRIVLTKQARTMVERADCDVMEMEKLLQKGMSEEEIVQLHKYLDQILKNIGGGFEENTRCCGSRRKRVKKKEM